MDRTNISNRGAWCSSRARALRMSQWTIGFSREWKKRVDIKIGHMYYILTDVRKGGQNRTTGDTVALMLAQSVVWCAECGEEVEPTT
jgi:hypothetical protein